MLKVLFQVLCANVRLRDPALLAMPMLHPPRPGWLEAGRTLSLS